MTRTELRLIIAGTMLIGVSYGLARYTYGLFLPGMREDVDLSSTMAGVIGGGAYIGYCSSIVLGALMVERLGPRFVAVAAALIAAAGMAVISLSTSPWLLAGAILLAGTSAGMASPAMAQAVTHAIEDAQRGRVNTLINAGTSLGVAISGPVAFIATGQWRLAYAAFAVAALINAVLLMISLPPARSGRGVGPNAEDVGGGERHDEAGELWRPRALRVALAATGMGTASAAYWTFAGEAVVTLGDFDQSMANIVWIVIGIAGLVGGLAGDLVRRFGLNIVNRVTLMLLALSLGLLALLPSSFPAVLLSAGLFGGAYIMLSGIYLMWGIRVYWDRPAIGISLPFLMIAVGQIVGSPIAGYLIGSRGYVVCFIASALMAVVTALIGYRQESRDLQKPAPKPTTMPARKTQLSRFYMPAMPPLALIEKRRHRPKD